MTSKQQGALLLVGGVATLLVSAWFGENSHAHGLFFWILGAVGVCAAIGGLFTVTLPPQMRY